MIKTLASGRKTVMTGQIKRLTSAQIVTLVKLWQSGEIGISSETVMQSERERLVRLVAYGYAKKEDIGKHWHYTVTPNGKWRLLEPGRLIRE